jgi:hypothetical protein
VGSRKSSRIFSARARGNEEKVADSANTVLQNVTPLLLSRALQRPFNRGHGFGRVNNGHGFQGEPVGGLMLERTKSGKRREVSMRPVVDAVFAAMPEPRVGLVWPGKSIRTAFENAVATAGLTDFTFPNRSASSSYAHLSPGHLRAEMNKTAISSRSSHGTDAAAVSGEACVEVAEL